LRDPVDGSVLRHDAHGDVLTSADGARRYPVVDGIPCLFAPNEWPAGRADVTDMVKSFYEVTPFPNYDDLDSRRVACRRRRGRGVFARLPRRAAAPSRRRASRRLRHRPAQQLPRHELGRTVIGADLCLNSLRLAKAFRDRCSIANAQFVQMNLFRPPFPDATFDLVVCNGVLHHTSDPRAGFDGARAQGQARRPRDHRPLQTTSVACRRCGAAR
jgi:hypothetical protein